ncbi:Signal transduction histidine kinase [Flavobacterium caeni]|uniref:Signal transduction histidine kinase n=2 Tax=Flavobacterium caeni TaxID=490189 RepID=A0A1G5H641_9FLAO|nr:Signal transduction histidine kinase [Flavobacterium caeni]
MIFFIILAVGCKQAKEIDANESPSSDSVYHYLTSAKRKDLSATVRIENTNKAFRILTAKENTKSTRNDLNTVAQLYYDLRQESKAIEVATKVVESSISVKDSLNIARGYNTLGNQFIDKGANDSAYYFFLKAEKLFSPTRDSIYLAKNYIDKAFVQLYESDYSGCELSCIQALSFYKSSSYVQNQYNAFNLIGISSNELKNFDNALIYHRKALDFVNRYPEISQSKVHYRSSTYNNIGYVYQNLNNHREAIKNFNLGLAERNLLKDNPLVYAALTDNLAYSKFKLKEYQDLPRLFFEALKIREVNKLYSGVVASKLHLSEFYVAKSDSLSAQKMAYEAFLLAKKSRISGDLLGSLKQLSAVEQKNASLYSKEYIRISDSIQNEERKAKDKFARIAFETDEIISQKDKLAEQNRNLVYFFIGTLLIGVLLFVIRNQRAKNRELLLVQAQQKANEEIYSLMISQQRTIEESREKEKKRIAQELHDGVLGRLFGARLNLDSLNKLADDDAIESRFNYLNELKNIEQDIREISHDLNREKHALINNFLAIVNNLLEEQKSSHSPGIEWTIDEKIKWDNIDNALKINIFRILQESLQNINKYANAENIFVKIGKNYEKMELEITDDGIGFDVSIKKKGIGLQNIESRVKESGGDLMIKSKKGKGTKIFIDFTLGQNL